MRRAFAQALHEQMKQNDNIFFLTGDLGYKVFDEIMEDFPSRAFSTGAAEQALLDIGVGLALEGKIPFCYTITPFFLRGFETIRTYMNHENIPVHMVGSGRDKDYAHDGFSHDASDIKDFLTTMKNVTQYYPDSKDDIPAILATIINSRNPSFLSLKR